jgi:hypothetical protein
MEYLAQLVFSDLKKYKRKRDDRSVTTTTTKKGINI